MSDEQELKLACLHQAGGNLDHAKALYAWVSGENAPSPDADFESGFYCGLKDSPTSPGSPSGMRGWRQGDALRKRFKEMEARLRTRGEDAEGVHDKAIAALSTEREGGLFDTQSPSVDDEVRNQAEGEASPDALAKLLEVAFREGAAAYHEGGRVNPYPEPGEMFEAWWNGFYFEEDADGGPAPNAERISDESQAELVIEQTEESDIPALTDQQYQSLERFEDEGTPVLDAEPPSIPRSEIPEGAAVETFTDTGVETVKIGGITRVVEDVADTRQGDAAVFARGILEENSEEPQGRRFGFTPLFGKKAEPVS